MAKKEESFVGGLARIRARTGRMEYQGRSHAKGPSAKTGKTPEMTLAYISKEEKIPAKKVN